jgi:ectoine hydroxylase-related dioxygenase (phytanoyl-CoA dioxygenase family)
MSRRVSGPGWDRRMDIVGLKMTRITEEQVTEFERDGVILLRGVINEGWRTRVAAAIERDMAEPGPHHHGYESKSGRFHATSRTWELDDDLRAYVFESPLPGLAAALLRSRKVNLLYDQMFVKEPGTEAPTPWHCDHVVWPLAGNKVVSFWLALDPVTKDSGRVEYVRGSHKWGRKFQPRPFAKSRLSYPTVPGLEEFPDIEAHRENYDIVGWDMEPGDVVAFTSWTFHGASGNSRSDRRRRGYSVRYTGDDVRYAPDQFTVASTLNPELKPGDELDSSLFPVVWRDGAPVPSVPSAVTHA